MADDYFLESQTKEVAAFLGLSLPEFLSMRNVGRFPLNLARPVDPRMAYFKTDLQKWMASGRPIAWIRPGVDPTTGKRKPSVET